MKACLTPIALASMALFSSWAYAEPAVSAAAKGEGVNQPALKPAAVAASSDATVVVAENAHGDATKLPTVTVSGQKAVGYTAERTTTATKTDTPLRDVPQSVTVITEQLIKDQSMQSMADVVRYVPGTIATQGENNRDAVILRGTSSTADFYVNGVRDDMQYFRDLYNIEQVEVLKGPNAMIFGRGGGGGVINRVTKQADWTPVREVSLQGGSYSDRRISADMGQALSKSVAGRITGVYEYSNSFRDGFNLERFGINPTVALRASDKTRVVFGYEFFKDHRTADRGITSLNGRPYDTDRSTFFGDPDNSFAKAEVNALTALVEHTFNEELKLRNHTRYGDYDRMYQNYVSGKSNGTTVPITTYNNSTQRKNLFNQTDLIWETGFGGMKHTILSGLELGRQKTDNYRETGLYAAGPGVSPDQKTYNAPLSNPNFRLPVTYSRQGNDADNNGVTTLAAVYVQDQLEITPKFQAVAGLRYDYFHVNYNDMRPTPTGVGKIKTTDGLISPRVALMYKPIEAVTAYTSYSVSALPRAGEQLASLTLANKSFDPEKYKNIEVGLKWDMRPDLALTTAVYKQDRKNVAVNDPSAPGTQILLDGQRVVGLEIGLAGYLTRQWSIAGGYAYQLGEILQTQPVATGQTPTIQKGATLGQVPANMFSLWNRYDFTPMWGAGLGMISRSAMFAATEDVATPANNVTLAGYMRFDGAVFFTLNKNFQAQLNIENLLDKEYFMNADNNTNITPGSPRAVRASITAKF